MNWGTNETRSAARSRFGVSDVVEVPLPLTAGQAAELEEAAHRCGLTLAQALRGIVRDFLNGDGAGMARRPWEDALTDGVQDGME